MIGTVKPTATETQIDIRKTLSIHTSILVCFINVQLLFSSRLSFFVSSTSNNEHTTALLIDCVSLGFSETRCSKHKVLSVSFKDLNIDGFPEVVLINSFILKGSSRRDDSRSRNENRTLLNATWLTALDVVTSRLRSVLRTTNSCNTQRLVHCLVQCRVGVRPICQHNFGNNRMLKIEQN